MATAPKPLDWAAYVKLPETKRRYDIVDGVLRYMTPSPGWFHQTVSADLLHALLQHVKRQRLGEVRTAPLDVIISRGPLRVRQPDLLFVSRARLEEVVRDDRVQAGPDLVIEILSPGNTRKHVEQKLRDYAAAGVRETWILEGKGKTITVLAPVGGEFRETAVYRPGQRLRSRVLPKLRLDLGKVFR